MFLRIRAHCAQVHNYLSNFFVIFPWLHDLENVRSCSVCQGAHRTLSTPGVYSTPVVSSSLPDDCAQTLLKCDCLFASISWISFQSENKKYSINKILLMIPQSLKWWASEDDHILNLQQIHLLCIAKNCENFHAFSFSNRVFYNCFFAFQVNISLHYMPRGFCKNLVNSIDIEKKLIQTWEAADTKNKNAWPNDSTHGFEHSLSITSNTFFPKS